jgi:hypothetical protein
MAESTLSVLYDDIREDIAFDIGYGRSSANWSNSQEANVNSILKKGLRQFYHPPVLPGEANAHDWHFMNIATSQTVGVTTGTMSGTATTTMTATSGVFQDRMADVDFPATITFDTSGTAYIVDSVTSTSVVVLTTDASVEVSGDTFQISAQRDYDLPDDFGAINGILTFASTNYYNPIKIVGEGEIRNMRTGNVSTSFPYYAAIRSKNITGAVGQRQEIMFYPSPNGTYTLSYAYTPLPFNLTGSLTYPYGGEIHGQTIEASCLAEAEQFLGDEKGTRWSDFMQKLQTSVTLDRKNFTPEFLGKNRNDRESRFDEINVYDGVFTTINGVIPG